MRKILPILLAVSVFFSSCAAIAAAEAEADKEGAELAKAALATGDIRIEVRDVLSQYGPVIHSNGEYYVQIKDGKATSYLPFFGTSTSATYGSSDGGIKFENCPVKVTDVKARKFKGEAKWKFVAKDDREEIEFILTFYDNGAADIYCKSMSKSPMNYNGRLDTVK